MTFRIAAQALEKITALGEVVANLAVESAKMLPRISQWPGIHWMWDRANVLLMERRRVSRSGEEPSSYMYRDWLSVKMATDVDWSRCWLIQSTANCMALFSCCASIHHGAYDIRGCRVAAGGDDNTCTTISSTCAGQPFSVDVILSVQLTGSAQCGGLDGEVKSWRLTMPGRDGSTGQCFGQTSVPRVHGKVVEDSGVVGDGG